MKEQSINYVIHIHGYSGVVQANESYQECPHLLRNWIIFELQRGRLTR